MPPLFPLTLALYAAACTICFVVVARPQFQGAKQLQRPLLLAGLLSQTADIAWLCLRGQHPASSAREALFFASFLMVLLLLLRTFRQPIPLLGALLLPVAMCIDALTRVLPQTHPVAGLSAVSVSPRLALLHISSASLGIALFGVAAATSVLYLVSERRLKRGRLPRAAGAEAGPSLEFLDRLNRHSIIFGLLTFTAALVSGTYWLLEAPLPGSRPDEPGLLLQVSHLLSQSRYTLAMVTWLLFAGLLVGRAALGLRGRRAAQVTLLGFCTSIGVLAFYLWRDMAGH